MKYDDMFDNVNIFLDNYAKNNIDKIKFNTDHKATELYYLLSRKDKKFINFFKLSALKSYAKNGKVEFPLETEPFLCNDCDKYVKFILNNNEISADDNKCFYEKIHSVNINIPSGKLILADWPEFMSDIIHIKDLNVNSLIGRVKQSENFEKENIMHFFVGNTSPVVSQKGNQINFEYTGYDEETDEEIYYDKSFDIKERVYTDLWWVTGIDFDLYNTLLINKFGESILSSNEYKSFIENCLILNVEPGTYVCTSFYELESLHRDDYSFSKLFINIERYIERFTKKEIEDDQSLNFKLFIIEGLMNENGYYSCEIELIKNEKILKRYLKRFKFVDFTEKDYEEFMDEFCKNIIYREDFNIENESREIRKDGLIDPEIQEIIKELNEINLTTKYSCQGTKDKWSDRPCKKDGHSFNAYVKFENNLPEKFIEILKQNNQLFCAGPKKTYKNNNYDTIYSNGKENNAFFSKNIKNAIDQYKKSLENEE